MDKTKLQLVLILILGLNPLVTFSNSDPYFAGPSDAEVNKNFSLGQAKQESAETFANPVVLLVGLTSNELSYRELSNISGFDFFNVPYGTDVESIISKVNPSQVIIKHPSGFTGLYTNSGQLVRGVELQSINSAQIAGLPSSIVKPEGANQIYSFPYPGGQTGNIPHGGLGQTTPPQSPTFKGHMFRFLANGSAVPLYYLGGYGTRNAYTYNDFANPSNNMLFPFLIAPVIPELVTTVAAYFQAKENHTVPYEEARTQPRDYNFQPVIEGD